MLQGCYVALLKNRHKSMPTAASLIPYSSSRSESGTIMCCSKCYNYSIWEQLSKIVHFDMEVQNLFGVATL